MWAPHHGRACPHSTTLTARIFCSISGGAHPLSCGMADCGTRMQQAHNNSGAIHALTTGAVRNCSGAHCEAGQNVADVVGCWAHQRCTVKTPNFDDDPDPWTCFHLIEEWMDVKNTAKLCGAHMDKWMFFFSSLYEPLFIGTSINIPI